MNFGTYFTVMNNKHYPFDNSYIRWINKLFQKSLGLHFNIKMEFQKHDDNCISATGEFLAVNGIASLKFLKKY